jgi:hypothetical protein
MSRLAPMQLAQTPHPSKGEDSQYRSWFHVVGLFPWSAAVCGRRFINEIVVLVRHWFSSFHFEGV